MLFVKPFSVDFYDQLEKFTSSRAKAERFWLAPIRPKVISFDFDKNWYLEKTMQNLRRFLRYFLILNSDSNLNEQLSISLFNENSSNTSFA